MLRCVDLTNVWMTLKVWLHCAAGLELTVFPKASVLNRAFLPSADHKGFSLLIVQQINTIQLLKQSMTSITSGPHALEIIGTSENLVLAS